MSILKKIKEKRLLPLILACFFVIAVAIILLLLWRTGLFALLKNPEELSAYIDNTSGVAILYLFLCQIIVVLFVPFAGAVPAIAGGLLFGFWVSFFICSFALLFGSCINFALARYFGRPFVEYFVAQETIDKYLNSFDEKKKNLLFLMFFFPGFPDTILCFIAGLTNLRWKTFIFIAALGRPWGLALSSLIGTGALAVPAWSYLVLGFVFLLILVASYKFSSQISTYLHRKVLDKFTTRRSKNKR